jgi:hypothetical protein
MVKRGSPKHRGAFFLLWCHVSEWRSALRLSLGRRHGRRLCLRRRWRLRGLHQLGKDPVAAQPPLHETPCDRKLAVDQCLEAFVGLSAHEPPPVDEEVGRAKGRKVASERDAVIDPGSVLPGCDRAPCVLPIQAKLRRQPLEARVVEGVLIFEQRVVRRPEAWIAEVCARASSFPASTPAALAQRDRFSAVSARWFAKTRSWNFQKSPPSFCTAGAASGISTTAATDAPVRSHIGAAAPSPSRAGTASSPMRSPARTRAPASARPERNATPARRPPTRTALPRRRSPEAHLQLVSCGSRPLQQHEQRQRKAHAKGRAYRPTSAARLKHDSRCATVLTGGTAWTPWQCTRRPQTLNRGSVAVLQRGAAAR